MMVWRGWILVQLNRIIGRFPMQRVRLYGIQYSSVLRTYRESTYFYRLCDAMEVCSTLNEQEHNRKLNKTYLPFSTTLQTLEHHSRLVDKERKSECEKAQLRHQLGINNYKVFESASEYFATTQAECPEVPSELEIGEK